MPPSQELLRRVDKADACQEHAQSSSVVQRRRNPLLRGSWDMERDQETVGAVWAVSLLPGSVEVGREQVGLSHMGTDFMRCTELPDIVATIRLPPISRAAPTSEPLAPSQRALHP